jgi:hypothetical protein
MGYVRSPQALIFELSSERTPSIKRNVKAKDRVSLLPIVSKFDLFVLEKIHTNKIISDEILGTILLKLEPLSFHDLKCAN